MRCARSSAPPTPRRPAEPDAEIVPVTANMAVKDKETGAISMKEVTAKDEGNRPETTIEGLRALQPVMGPDAVITAGNASQLSDSASASVLMEASLAAERGLQPLGRYLGMAVAGTEPGRDGHRPGLRGAQAAQALWPQGGTISACGS